MARSACTTYNFLISLKSRSEALQLEQNGVEQAFAAQMIKESRLKGNGTYSNCIRCLNHTETLKQTIVLN